MTTTDLPSSFDKQIAEFAGDDAALQDMNAACEQARRELTAEANNPFVAGCMLISKTLQAIAVAIVGGGSGGDGEESGDGEPASKHEAAPKHTATTHK